MKGRRSVLYWSQGATGKMILAVLFELASSLLPLVFAIQLGRIVDDISIQNFIYLPLTILIAGLISVSIIIMFHLSKIISSRLHNAVLKNIRNQYANKLNTARIDVLEKQSFGELLSIYNNEINILGEFVSKHIINIFTVIVSFIIAIIYISQLHIIIALCSIIPAFFTMLAVRSISAKINIKQTMYLENATKNTESIVDGIYGRAEIQANNAQNWFNNRFARATKNRFDSKYKVSVLETAVMYISMGQSNFSMVFVLVVGGLLAYQGIVSIGDVITAFMSFHLLSNPIRNLSNYLSRFQKGLSSHRRLSSIMDISSERLGGESNFNKEESRQIQLNIDKYVLDDERKFSLDDINLSILSNQFVAIIGSSGSGKSTLAKLLAGYDEDCEGIKISGIDLKSSNISSLRKHLLYVSNDYYLYMKSLKENFYMAECTDEKRIKSALKTVEMDIFVDEHVEGLDFMLHENGSNISGGERQRLIMGIALTQEAEIYVFDELFSAVSEQQQQSIFDNIKSKFKDKTFIFITHQTTFLNKMDNIYFMRKGRISLSGKHEVLMNEKEYKSFIEGI